MEFKSKFFVWIGVLLIQTVSFAQMPEQVTLTIKQAEELFFKNNFVLLAQQYNVGKAEAAIIQSKVYPNPEITADIVAYQGQENLYFPGWNHGNLAVGLEQLLIMGGKRRKQIDIAKLDKKMAEAELTDLTRNLQMQIWESFYTLHHQQRVIEKYDKLLEKLQSLIKSYEVQVAKNNIALKDLIRLKSVYVKINNDKSEEAKTLIEEQQKLNILIGSNKLIVTAYTDDEAGAFAGQSFLYDVLVSQSFENRPDFNQASLAIEAAKLNVSLQKKQVIPDVTFRAGYNQQGDAFNNQYNVGIGIPLPVFDRNRGNIQSAKITQEQSAKNAEYKQVEITNQVLAAYQNYTRSVGEFKNINGMVNEDFDAVFSGINSNFLKGNVSMIEFADFFEAYNEAQTEVERVKKELALAAAQINYVTGKNNF